MHKKLLLFVFLIFSDGMVCSASIIDSLETVLNERKDSSRISVLISLTWEYRGVNIDKSMAYASEGIALCDKFSRLADKSNLLNKIGAVYIRIGKFKEAEKCFTIALSIANGLKDSLWIAKSLGGLSEYYSYTGNFDSSNYYISKAIEISRRNHYHKVLAAILTNQAISFIDKGNLEAGLMNLQEAMTLFEELGETQSLRIVVMNIAVIYNQLKNLDESLKYMEKSLLMFDKLDDKKTYAFCLSNIATIYLLKKDTAKAIDYVTRAISESMSVDDNYGLSNEYDIMGVIYRGKEMYEKSLDYDLSGLKIREKMNDNKGIAESYYRIGITYNRLKQYEKSEDFLIKSIELAKHIGLKAQEYNSYMELAHTYFQSGNYKQAYEFHELFYLKKDSVLNENAQRQLTEMQTKYETDKKEKEIELLNKDKLLHNAEIQRQRTIRNAIIAGFGLVLFSAFIIGLVIYNMYRIKKKANRELAQRNVVITQQKEEIEAQRDEICDQNDVLQKHKNILEGQKKDIDDSINYALRLQQAMLPSESTLANFQFRHFILFQPKDIVSGDFYWAVEIRDWFIFAVADCTGHGVPGAFMSMLGISFLNEIVCKKEVTKASQVLDMLRENVIEALQQRSYSNMVGNASHVKASGIKDGMDISLCAIYLNTLQCQWAGANNPMYIIRKRQSDSGIFSVITDNNEMIYEPNMSIEEYNLFELKPDKMPIGIYEKMNPFHNHEIQLETGDMLYLLSDGFADQFGGKKGKKFKYKPFKKLLHDIHCQKPEIQLERLQSELLSWMHPSSQENITIEEKNYEQVDDITVMGVRIE